MNLQLHLTDDTQLRAHGFVADGTLFAEVHWDFPAPGSHGGEGTLWGTPAMLRQLAAALSYAARGIPIYPVHWPHSIPPWGRPGLLVSPQTRL